jgi:FkbM family methyltransferase
VGTLPVHDRPATRTPCYPVIDLVVTACHERDLPIWSTAAEALRRRVATRRFLVLVPDSQLAAVSAATPEGFDVRRESEYVAAIMPVLADRLRDGGDPARFGWYVQQFAKLAALDVHCDLDRILIWDSDTVPLRNLTFFEDGQAVAYSGSEYHIPYFDAIDRLLGMDKIVTPSFVAQCLPLRGRQARGFFDEIERHGGRPWWMAVLNAVDLRIESGFSEYETLGTYLSHRFPDELCITNRRWARINAADLGASRDPEAMDRALTGRYPDCDFVTVETDAGPGVAQMAPGRTHRALLPGRTRGRTIAAAVRRAGGASRAAIHRRRPAPDLDEHVRSIFATPGLAVVQIGANEGNQNDPLRPFLARPGSYCALLVEPLPTYAEIVTRLYAGRPDVDVRQVAASSRSGLLTLHHIPMETALRMNGDGPPNNWALGQGSTSRATVVHWIHMNAFRGAAYRAAVPEWIAAIESVTVPAVRTDELIPDAENVLLVVDVQGHEAEVIRGLDPERLPRWVVIEEDTGDTSARHLLIELGYHPLLNGSDSLFERRQREREAAA